jgi:hypothetical protein
LKNFFEEPKTVISVGTDDKISNKFSLSQNYPNPFNPSTLIQYSLPETVEENIQSVQLVVYDILGREVATLVNQKQKPGNYKVEFDGRKLTSGVYFYQLTAGTFTNTKKLILMK